MRRYFVATIRFATDDEVTDDQIDRALGCAAVQIEEPADEDGEDAGWSTLGVETSWAESIGTPLTARLVTPEEWDRACDACGSPAGEPCSPMCVGLAALADEIAVYLAPHVLPGPAHVTGAGTITGQLASRKAHPAYAGQDETPTPGLVWLRSQRH